MKKENIKLIIRSDLAKELKKAEKIIYEIEDKIEQKLLYITKEINIPKNSSIKLSSMQIPLIDISTNEQENRIYIFGKPEIIIESLNGSLTIRNIGIHDLIKGYESRI